VKAQGRDWTCRVALHQQDLASDDPRKKAYKHGSTVKANARSYSNLMSHLEIWHGPLLAKLKKLVQDGKNNKALQDCVAEHNASAERAGKASPLVKAFSSLQERSPNIVLARIFYALHGIRSGHSFNCIEDPDLDSFFDCLKMDRSRVLGNRAQYGMLASLLHAFFLYQHRRQLLEEEVPAFAITTDGWANDYVS